MLRIFLFFVTFSMMLNAASIKGTVDYAGPKKSRKDLEMNSDPVCDSAHKNKPGKPLKEDFILDENNNLKNVIVWIKNADFQGELSADAVTIDQIGCMYTPHVNVVTTGQKVLIKNSDKTLHNVNSKSKINESFNSAQPAGVPDIEKTFPSAEDPFYIKCDVHPWMKAWVMVTDHPYFAVTDGNGNFEINNVPPGEYELGFWHERLSNLPKKKFIQVDHTITFSITESAVESNGENEVREGVFTSNSSGNTGSNIVLDYTFPRPAKKPK